MKKDSMDRRRFLMLMGRNALMSSGVWLFPGLAVGEKSAFDLGLAGQDMIQKGDFAGGVALLEKAARLAPEDDWIFGLLGRAYHGMGKNAEAVHAFRQAFRINPADTYSRMMVDVITQKPVGAAPREERPPTPLEQAAMEEEAAMLDKLTSSEGLDYKARRVVIDPGHGGFDSGAVGKNGLKEKDVVLDLAIKLHERLGRGGVIKSFLTRTGDYYVPLSARTATANQFQADLFISVHINAFTTPNPHGVETYYCSETASSKEAAQVAAFENAVLKYDEPYRKQEGYIDIEEILLKFEQKTYWAESGNFARAFQERFKQHLPLRNRGVHSANFYVLRRARMPSILLETGFISNPDDEAKLAKPEFRQQIADAAARGLT